MHDYIYKQMRARDSSSSKQPRPLLPRPRPSSTISGASIATAQQSHQKKGLSSALTSHHMTNPSISKLYRLETHCGWRRKQTKKLWIFLTYSNGTSICNISLSKNVQWRSNKAATIDRQHHRQPGRHNAQNQLSSRHLGPDPARHPKRQHESTNDSHAHDNQTRIHDILQCTIFYRHPPFYLK